MLYKFLNPARIDVLKTLKIRFTQPSGLNDPFESNFLVDAGNFVDMEAKVIELTGELPTDTPERRALVSKLQAEMRAYGAEAMSPQSVGRGLAGFLNRSLGVLSLSRVNNNLLMWAHYGDSHTGYVLGLDESHAWFHGIDQLGRPINPRNVIYTSRRPIATTGTDEFYERLLCYKSVDWAYEEEVRLFRSFGLTEEDFDRNDPGQCHLFRLPRECIKEIFIGANASSQLKNEIFAVVKKHRLVVDIFEAVINRERYEINFRPVKQIPDYRQKG